MKAQQVNPIAPQFTSFLQQVEVTNLSRAQLVYCAVVFDRVDPIDLAEEGDRAIAAELFGPVERVPEAARHVIATLKGARVGGTWRHSLFLLYSALTTPLVGLAAGEQAFAVIMAPDLELARQAIRYVIGAAEHPTLARFIVAQDKTSLQVRRPDGRYVKIQCFAASRGGTGGRSRTLVAALLDEAAFFRGDDAVVNADEIFRAVVMRVLPGGSVSLISTVWSESDLLTSKVNENFGNPQSALAAKCPTLVMRNDPLTQQIVADERERDPENAAREFDCIPFVAGSGLFFDAPSIRDAADDSLPLVTGTVPSNCAPGVGCDTGLVSDSSAGVVVHRNRTTGVVTVAEVVELKPTKGNPLQLSAVCETYARLMQRHGVKHGHSDGHELIPSLEHLKPFGCTLHAVPGGAEGKLRTYDAARQLLHSGKLRIPAKHHRLIRQLQQITSRPLPGGMLKISSPRRGGHGDLVSALICAIWSARAAAKNGDSPGVIFGVSSRRGDTPSRVLERPSYNQDDPTETGFGDWRAKFRAAQSN